MKPARALLSKDIVPIDYAGLQLGNGRVATIVTSEGGAYAEAAFRKIESVARGVAYSIVFNPADQRLVDTALINKILKKPADGIIGKRGDDGGVQAEAALQSTSDIIFAAALADFEGTRRGDAAVAWIEAEHDFAQTDDIPAAIFLRFDRQAHVVPLAQHFTGIARIHFSLQHCALQAGLSSMILAGSSLGARS